MKKIFVCYDPSIKGVGGRWVLFDTDEFENREEAERLYLRDNFGVDGPYDSMDELKKYWVKFGKYIVKKRGDPRAETRDRSEPRGKPGHSRTRHNTQGGDPGPVGTPGQTRAFPHPA